MTPPVAILHAPGTNRDREAAWACAAAGGAPEIVHMSALAAGGHKLKDYRMLVLPGGFSYGDDLGAGKVWSVGLAALHDALSAFIDAGKPVLGICNGFQTLIKAGFLPGLGATQAFTLTRNDSARFECRWVHLEPDPKSPCVFTRGLTEPIACPVAHGEGKVVAVDEGALSRAKAQGLVALRYGVQGGGEVVYPHNPNGSPDHIAGLTNPRGNVLGLMPHPEDHITARQHPQHHRGAQGGLGLRLFEAGIRYAAQL